MARASSSFVLYRLGRDGDLGLGRRTLARILSVYQRAPVHLLADVGWGDFDLMISSLLRAALLRLSRRRACHWRQQPAGDPPSSGWGGSFFVLAVWSGLLLALNQVLPVLPASVALP